MELSLHRLREAMDSDDGYFNTTSFEYAAQSLGSLSFMPRPQQRRTIEIRLADQLGQQLFAMLQDQEETITEESQFLDFLPGFCLLPATSSNSSIIGLVPGSTQLRLYFTDYSELPKRQFLRTFSVGSSLIYFNHIETNYRNAALTPFAENADAQQVDAQQTGSKAFVQGGAGLTIRMEFPYLRNLLENHEDFIVSRALLHIDPVPDQASTKPAPPETLGITVVDGENDLLSGALTTTRLSVDEEFNRDTYYEIDLTEFIKVQMALEEYNENALLFNVDSPRSSVERLVLPGSKPTERPVPNDTFIKNKITTNMKYNYLFIPCVAILLLLTTSCLQEDEEELLGNWVSSSDFEGITRSGAVSFSIGDFAYAGMGFDGDDYLRDFWRYDPQLDFWTKTDSFPGTGRTGAVAFNVGNKGYLATGYNGDDDVEFRDLWEFDPTAPAGQMWQQKTDFIGSPRYNAVAFSIGEFGYVGTGYDGNYLKDFYRYHPASDQWEQIVSLRGSKREDAAAFVVDARPMSEPVGATGSMSLTFGNTTPRADTWIELLELDEETDYSIIRHGAVGFALDGLGYIATGSSGSNLTSIWQYDPAADTWEEKTALEGSSRIDAIAFVVANRAFVTTGRNGSFRFDDLWEFLPNAEYDEED